MSSKNKKFLQRFRVPLGFIFGAVFLIFADPTPLFLAIGSSIAICGLLIRAWSSGHIRKNQDLAVSGPYAYTRNPLYLGSFLLGLGFMVASAVWWLGLLFAVLFLGIYFPVMSVESDELRAIFGKKFDNYAAKVPLFFPRLRKAEPSEKRFELSLYLRYREYQASLGSLFAFLVLAIKAFILK